MLGNLTPEKFIRQYWQQRSLMIPGACPEIATCISAQDLLAMARAPECESRLVTANRKQTQWQSQTGPISAKQLKQWEAAPWTLLVQAVDQWIPAVADLLKVFEFLPRWRLDDIMISLANSGGGVGPHFDYYDVFLLQACGQRHWRLGQHCDEQSPLRDHPTMKLLKTFEQTEEHLLQPGDLLYVPAGMAHWGTSRSDVCITISIGFRAASQRELIQLAMERMASQAREHVRYRDSKASIDPDPFCINGAALQHVEHIWNAAGEELRREAFAQALGIQATEVRYPENIEVPGRRMTIKTLQATLARKKSLHFQHSVASRFAWRVLKQDRAELYVNGEVYETSRGMAQGICHQTLEARDLKNLPEQQLFLELVNQGCLILKSGA